MKPIKSYQVRTHKDRKGVDLVASWLDGLDKQTRVRIKARIERVANGNLGDCKAVGGVFELRLDFGPGYRIYFGIVGGVLILLLCAGDKRTQDKDIKKAKKLLDEFEGSI